MSARTRSHRFTLIAWSAAAALFTVAALALVMFVTFALLGGFVGS